VAPSWRNLVAGKHDQLELALRFGSERAGWRWYLGSVGVDRELGLTIGTYQETTALRDAEQRFQRAFEDAGIGMAITGIDGRFVRVNRSLATMLGREQRELSGMLVADVTHPSHLEADRDAMRALAAGDHATYRAEKRYLRADGTEAWVSLSSSVVRDADGSPRYFISQMTDISERRAAERALAQSEERFRTLAAASPVGIFAITDDGRLAYASEHLREIFGSVATPSKARRGRSASRRTIASAWSPSSVAHGRSACAPFSTCASRRTSIAGRGSTPRRPV